MHWLAIVFLVIKAIDNILDNVIVLGTGSYNSFLAYLCGAGLNAFAWVYILTYLIRG